MPSQVVGIVRDLIDLIRERAGVDHLTDGIAAGLYSLADDLRRQAHPEWPDLRPMVHELRLAVPEDIHPQARCFIHEWLTEAEYAVMPTEAMRLASHKLPVQTRFVTRDNVTAEAGDGHR